MSTWRLRPEQARDALEESAAITRAGGSGTTFGICVGLLAQLLAPDDPEGALGALRDGMAVCRDRDRLQIGAVVDRGVIVFSTLGEHELAAVLGGLITSGVMASLSSLSPEERDERAAALDAARRALGVQEYRDATGRGATMEFDDVVDYMLSELDRLIAQIPDGARRAPS